MVLHAYNFSIFLRWSITVSPRVECSGTISAHCILCLLKSWDYSERYYTRLIFVFLVDTGFHHVGQADFELLTLSDPTALASQSARITGAKSWCLAHEVF